MSSPLVDPGPELTRDQRQRYVRNLLVPQIGEVGQRRLLNARVAMLGAGGLGSAALLYLAAAGVGHLTIIDDDDVDASNLQRQVVHDISGLGSPKVDSASFRVRGLNPEVQVTTRRTRLDADNALRLLEGHHLVLDGADNFEARYAISDACAALGVPHVWASVFRTQAQLSTFWRPGPRDGLGVGLRDVFPTAPDAADVPSCADAGVLGSLCGQVGSMMATEAIKLICGAGDPLIGRLVFVDALSTTQREITVRPSASAAGDHEPEATSRRPVEGESDVTMLAPRLLEAMLVDGEEPPLVLDVREPGEWQMGTIPGAHLVTLNDLLAGEAVALDRPIVVTCKTGPRAVRAAAELRRRGAAQVSVLAGGMAQWASEIDPTVIPY